MGVLLGPLYFYVKMNLNFNNSVKSRLHQKTYNLYNGKKGKIIIYQTAGHQYKLK